MIDPNHFFHTITEAVRAYRESTGAEWTITPEHT